MSVPAAVVRRFALKRQLFGRHVHERRTYSSAPEPPKDPANALARKILSKELNEERSLPDRRVYKDLTQTLKHITQLKRYGYLDQQRYSWFRDIVARCDVEGYGVILNTGIRRALEGHDTPSLPSQLLRQGESLLQTTLFRSGWNAPATLNTIGLEDTDATVLRLLPADRPSLDQRKRNLRTFNAFISRIERLKYPITGILAMEGQLLAANAQSAGALIRYAQKAVSQPQAHITNSADLAATMASIRLWVLEDEIQGAPQRTALSAMFAREEHNSTTHPSQAFRSQFAALDARWRWDYLDVLRRLHGPQEVLAAWNVFQKTAPWEELTAKRSEDSTVELASTLHDVVEQLLIANEPQLAWVIVHSLDWEARSILPKTWSLLLDFPEYLTKMNAGMQEVLLEIYQEKVERIEEALGVKWTGGEDGSHIFADDGGDPQAWVEDVNASKGAQKD